MFKVLIIFVYIAILCPFIAHGDFSMLGIDSEGREVEALITKSEYKKLMINSLKETQLLANKHKQIKVNGFFLHRISIGLGADAQIGFGPFKVGGGIQQKLYFERTYE